MFHLLTLGGAPWPPHELSCKFLHGYEVMCSIGVYESERRSPQRVVIDIAIFTRAVPEGAGDRIEDVVDYDFLREGIACLCADRHFDLQETLAREICALCLENPGVLGAAVATRKPDIYRDAEAVGCEMVRWKRPDV
ncbi:MAG: dihydroneopterin aldolase [Alphaproteobacteria bacterium]